MTMLTANFVIHVLIETISKSCNLIFEQKKKKKKSFSSLFKLRPKISRKTLQVKKPEKNFWNDNRK